MQVRACWQDRIRRAAVLAACATALYAVAHYGSARAAEAPGPAMPDDPVAAKAYRVFDQYCASCHQNGRIEPGKRAGGGIGNILDLDAVLADRRLVMPGLPEASAVFTAMLRRAMPPRSVADKPGESTGELPADAIDAVRAWLLRSNAAEQVDCDRGDYTLQPADHARLEAHAAALGAVKARTTRYLIIGRIPDSCKAKPWRDARVSALNFAINSLSWAPNARAVEPVNDDVSLVALDLSLIGWTVDQWEMLAGSSPYAAFTRASDAVTAATGSPLSIVRADWFAASALRAPTYYDLLALPDTMSGLVAALRPQAPAAGAPGRRFGIMTSEVSRGRRLIERYAFPNGGIWISAEHLTVPGRPDAILAPAPSPSEPLIESLASASARNDAALAHFDLPNGFRAYFAANANGQRVDDLATSVLADPADPSTRVGSGRGCISCHGGRGPNLTSARTDELAQRLAVDVAGLSKTEREARLLLHFTKPELERVLKDDGDRFAQAKAAGGVMAIESGSENAVLNPLLDHYERPLTVADAAIELGLSGRDLQSYRARLSPSGAEALKQLEFGSLTRPAFEVFAAEIGGLRHGDTGGGTGLITNATPLHHAEKIHISLLADARQVAVNDALSVRVKSDKPCYLTLLGVDTDSRTTVLFPNDFEQNNALEPDVPVTIPGPAAGYRLRFRHKGVETFIGICSSTQKTVDGIRHDFEKQRFTVLGDYRAYLLRSWDNAGDNEDPDARTTRGRAKADKRAPRTGKGEIQGRTAIQVRVE